MNAQTKNTGFVSCAVCGDTFATVAESMEHEHTKSDYAAPELSPEDVELFEKLWNAEVNVQGEKVSVGFAPIGLPVHLFLARKANLRKAQETLNALVDSLTPEQGKAYGAYRLGILADIAAGS